MPHGVVQGVVCNGLTYNLMLWLYAWSEKEKLRDRKKLTQIPLVDVRIEMGTQIQILSKKEGKGKGFLSLNLSSSKTKNHLQ